MGMLVDGVWQVEDPEAEIGAGGDFKRIQSVYRDRVTADGASGFKAEAGRYHLYAAWVCPWAHRTAIFRVLKGLEDAISISFALPDEGWTYGEDPAYPDCIPDTVNGFKHLYEAYTASDPRYTGKVTVPTLWDKQTGRVVNNESSEIIRMLNSAFAGVARSDTDYYPESLRPEIDAVNALVYEKVNNGVYRAGFARTQAAYEEAYDGLFAALDELEARLARHRYLVGSVQTEADWRLFPTLVRFDLAYFPLFKCNRQRIADFPNLSNYMRDLYATPGIAGTVKPRHYQLGYYSLRQVNPHGIVPKGMPIDYAGAHDRDRFA